MCAKTSELRSVCDVSVFAPSVLHETEEDKNGVASGQVPLINVYPNKCPSEKSCQVN